MYKTNPMAYIFLQREFRRKKVIVISTNKNLQSILLTLNGISGKLQKEYMIDNLTYDEFEIFMNKLTKVYDIYGNINKPITLRTVFKKKIHKILQRIESMKYLLHHIIKDCGAKKCSHILNILVSPKWNSTLSNEYLNLFNLYNKLFVPTSVVIENNNSITSINEQLPFAKLISTKSSNLFFHLNSAELICPLQNKNVKISGYFIVDPLNNYKEELPMLSKKKQLESKIHNFSIGKLFYNKYYKHISIRDFIVLTPEKIIEQMQDDYRKVLRLKTDSLPHIIKQFLTSNLIEQHHILTLLLLEGGDSKFLAHIIFDMLFNDSAVSNSSPYGCILYKNLHWSIQQQFKKSFSQYEELKKKISNVSGDQIPYETQIMALKASEDVKEKAMEKLKEINSSRDGSITAKSTKYLDGLLKIPFGIYKKEVIINYLTEFKIKINSVANTELNTEHQIQTYLSNNSLSYPELLVDWNKYQLDKKKYINFVRDTFDNCVHGHKDVKQQFERIIAQWINGEMTGAVLGLVGPPGIGKTCLIKNGLSKCLVDKDNNPRPFAFVPLGGATNGSFLDGHSFTYVGSTWGRIVDIVMQTKCMNPIIFIDELDKVSNTEHGREIVSILTHLTDSTQNTEFTDKYFAGIPFDLSKCLIVFTYNDASLIDRILRDRITSIELKPLSKTDKIVIANKYLLPEIVKTVGYTTDTLMFEDDSLEYIIDIYTYEAGVRKLKEKIFEIIREINLQRIHSNEIQLPYIITKEYITDLFLNKSKIQIKKIAPTPQCGIVNGLYATTAGIGGLTIIQVFKTISDSKELKLEYTGSQGDVMKESIKCARTIAWNIIPQSMKNKIKEDWEHNGTYGLHIHCPDTSTPKDGPSAGGAITLGIISRLCDIEINNKIAMTGEIDLNGNITAIGGVYSKVEGAFMAGAELVLLPEENRVDYNKIKDKLLKPGSSDEYKIEVKFIETIYDILETALLDHSILFEKNIS